MADHSQLMANEIILVSVFGAQRCLRIKSKTRARVRETKAVVAKKQNKQKCYMRDVSTLELWIQSISTNCALLFLGRGNGLGVFHAGVRLVQLHLFTCWAIYH